MANDALAATGRLLVVGLQAECESRATTDAEMGGMMLAQAVAVIAALVDGDLRARAGAFATVRRWRDEGGRLGGDE